MFEPKPGTCHCKAQARPIFIIEDSSDGNSSERSSPDFKEETVNEFFKPDFSKYRIARRSVSLEGKPTVLPRIVG